MLIRNLGILLVTIGICAADSPNMLIPFGIVVVGFLLIRKDVKNNE